jgi:hypothetical protein
VSRRDVFLRRAARRLGYNLVKADHYSPIPDLDAVPERWEDETPAQMPGVDLKLDESVEYLSSTLAPYIDEYSPPAHSPGTANGFYRDNPMYGALDAEVLYGIVRDVQPSRIVEVGAGFSTLVIEDALAKPREEGKACVHEVFDPYPAEILAGRFEVQALPAQAIPPSTFAALGDGDILFIDTTHTVRPGGDVNHLLLEVLPTVAPGVVIHVHDFFRPFDYPRFLYELGLYWQEHHLLEAFLAFNDSFEVVIANHAISRLRPDAVRAVVSGIDGPAGSALWMRRTG